MSGTTWTKFFWSDWESDPALRLCSFAGQGLWMRMLCIASAHDPIGYVAVAGRALDVSALARVTGGVETEVQTLLDELGRNGVFSRDRTGRIYSRRMVRDAKKAALARKNGRNGGNPALCNGEGNPPLDKPRVKGGDKPQKPSSSNHSREKDSNESSLSGAREHIPEGFPSKADIEAAEGWITAAGVKLSATEQAARFRGNAKTGERAVVNWPEAWRAWIEIEIAKLAPQMPAKAVPMPTFNGPPDFRARVVAVRGEGWTQAWLDQCEWRDVPTKALVVHLGFTADTLRMELEPLLAELGVSVLVEPRKRSAA